ncbi:DoxX family protein [Ensifer adhaerens]|uniref:DoxX family protein n=1 Tax=Ensifer adhaerens TaxID=106592 RepID=UPI001CBB8C59|nr:DoxX family protein [Ensifer adhaerens]MBZ7924263.1 DoxX family protein [Ensifer adhaerens]UAX96484.1 DoxX family protein [Ensifer adhaerens]UAY04173.1 DoxX family protein [Ensifer adhaerens]UAY12159.1 DoxX family protein [Ensifer adhaerens]
MDALITSVLTHPHFALAGKIVLTSLFWIAGLFGVFNFNAVVQEMVDVGLPTPQAFAVATIACQLFGSALIITNVAGLGWVGAIALAVFTLLTIPFGHAFWQFEGPKRMHEFQIALEHLTVVGGLALAGILSVKS